ncbi:MAG: hypothetical protein AAFZ65_18445, partial [Planctomycetota bacterium]
QRDPAASGELGGVALWGAQPPIPPDAGTGPRRRRRHDAEELRGLLAELERSGEGDAAFCEQIGIRP